MSKPTPQNWILDYLERNPDASAYDLTFHAEFRKAFPGSAVACERRAMRHLAALWKQGAVERVKCPLASPEARGPFWLYSYRLRKATPQPPHTRDGQ